MKNHLNFAFPAFSYFARERLQAFIFGQVMWFIGHALSPKQGTNVVGEDKQHESFVH